MTILVQEQALLRVTGPLSIPPPTSIDRNSLSSKANGWKRHVNPFHHDRQCTSECYSTQSTSGYLECSDVEVPSPRKFVVPTANPSFDIDDATLSTCSLLSDDTVDDLDSLSDEEPRRCVSFADDLITETWTRPRTPDAIVGDLFYSADDIQRFRNEYRLERKLVSDPDGYPSEAESDLSSLGLTGLTGDTVSPDSFQGFTRTRHSISRVVVVHNDKIETFISNPEDFSVSSDATALMPPGDLSSSCFFDNDAFWSGSITWY